VGVSDGGALSCAPKKAAERGCFGFYTEAYLPVFLTRKRRCLSHKDQVEMGRLAQSARYLRSPRREGTNGGARIRNRKRGWLPRAASTWNRRVATDKAMRMNVTIDLQHFSSHRVPMKVVITHPRVRRGFDHPASVYRPQAAQFGLRSFVRRAVRCFSQSTPLTPAITDFQHQQLFSGPTRHLYKDNERPGYQYGHQLHKQFQASRKA
jgi:hypothetical protein